MGKFAPKRIAQDATGHDPKSGQFVAEASPEAVTKAAHPDNIKKSMNMDTHRVREKSPNYYKVHPRHNPNKEHSVRYDAHGGLISHTLDKTSRSGYDVYGRPHYTSDTEHVPGKKSVSSYKHIHASIARYKALPQDKKQHG